jgi:hypothetical protein
LTGLAPCDFYLLEYIKARFTGASFEESGQLLQIIDVIFPSVKKATLERVLQE